MTSIQKTILPIQDEEVLKKRSEDRCKRILNELVEVISENSATAVYFNKINVQPIDNVVQSSLFGEIPSMSKIIHSRFPHVLFFDTAWDLINPTKWYKKLVVDGLNVPEESVLGRFTGNLNAFRCEKGGTVYKPEVEAGSHNPYKKMMVARVSASRRMKVLTGLEKTSKKKLSLIQTIITMPENVSNFLFNDLNGKEKFHKITKLFVKKYEVFLQGHAKVSKDFRIGVWLNEHPWSSKIPLNKHLHGHLCYPNILVHRKTQKFIRFKPFFSEAQLNAIKNLWKESIREVLGNHKDLEEEINVFHNYAKEKPQKLHLLKYCTRSWLHDLGKYFNNCQELKDDIRFFNYFNWMKKRFGRFVDWGAVENRTYALGFLHNTKKIFQVHDTYHDFKNDKTKHCDVCGSESSRPEKIEGFPKIRELAVLVGHKSSYRILGVFERN